MWDEAIKTILFYFLALISLFAASSVVRTPRILRAALALAGVLVCSAGFYVLLGYEFLAGVQVLVYVGGIVVLMVFAIMLTSSVEIVEDQPSPQNKRIGLLAAGVFFVAGVFAFTTTEFPTQDTVSPPTNEVSQLGKSLLDYGADGYVLPFEIISLLLLSVMVGGIVIARKSFSKEKE